MGDRSPKSQGRGLGLGSLTSCGWIEDGASQAHACLRRISSFHRKGVISTMTYSSILVKKMIDKMLHTARQNLEEDGSLQPTLFLHIAGDEILHMPLKLSDTFEKKARDFIILGRQLHERGLTPSEAVFFTESWFVNVQDAPAATKFAPSEHPARQEAIVAIGRTADNRRYTQVIQPFKWDKANRLVWLPIPLAMYDEERSSKNGPVGILDYLFETIPVSS